MYTLKCLQNELQSINNVQLCGASNFKERLHLKEAKFAAYTVMHNYRWYSCP